MSQSRSSNQEAMKSALNNLADILDRKQSVDRMFLKSELPSNPFKKKMRERLDFLRKIAKQEQLNLFGEAKSTSHFYDDNCDSSSDPETYRIATSMLYHAGEDEELTHFAYLWLYLNLPITTEFGTIKLHIHPNQKYIDSGDLSTAFSRSFIIIGPQIMKTFNQETITACIPSISKKIKNLSDEYYILDILLGKVMSPKAFNLLEYIDNMHALSESNFFINMEFTNIRNAIAQVSSDTIELHKTLNAPNSLSINAIADLMASKHKKAKDLNLHRKQTEILKQSIKNAFFDLLRKLTSHFIFLTTQSYETLNTLHRQFNTDTRSMTEEQLIQYDNILMYAIKSLQLLGENIIHDILTPSAQISTSNPAPTNTAEIVQITQTSKPDVKVSKTVSENKETKEIAFPKKKKILQGIKQRIKRCKNIQEDISKLINTHKDLLADHSARVNFIKEHLSKNIETMNDENLKKFHEDNDTYIDELNSLRHALHERLEKSSKNQALSSTTSEEQKTDPNSKKPPAKVTSNGQQPSESLFKRLHQNTLNLKKAIASIDKAHKTFLKTYKASQEAKSFNINPLENLRTEEEKIHMRRESIHLPEYSTAELNQDDARKLSKSLANQTRLANDIASQINDHLEKIVKQQHPKTTTSVIKELKAHSANSHPEQSTPIVQLPAVSESQATSTVSNEQKHGIANSHLEQNTILAQPPISPELPTTSKANNEQKKVISRSTPKANPSNFNQYFLFGNPSLNESLKSSNIKSLFHFDVMIAQPAKNKPS